VKKDILLSERAVTESACRASGRAAERHGTSMKQEDTKQGNQQKQEYEQYVKSVTPTHNLWAQMGKAFLTGGIICCIGQGILNYTGNVLGMDPQTAGSWCSLILVFASVVLTALHIYPKIVKWGGAGALVPITGFANSVTAPAVEYQKEGQVFGIGCKIFTIAGPVILYGIFASWALGLICWVLQMFGIQL
jgi:stage V sporulation protein AC